MCEPKQSSTTNEAHQRVLHVPAGTGSSISVAGDTYTIKASKFDTKGALAFMEASVPPGAGPTPHIHTREDEAYYLLFGELEILDQDRTFTARSGDFIYIPRGIRHRFLNRSIQTARMIFLFTPAGFDEFLLEVGKPAQPGIPTLSWGADDNKRISTIGPRYGRLP